MHLNPSIYLAHEPTPWDRWRVLRRRPPAKPKNAKGSRRALVFERILPIGLLAVALIGAPLLIFSNEGMPRLEAVESELSTVERENQELLREIDVLRARVGKLRDDPATVEQLARDELGLIRHTEVVFQFPE